MTYSATDIVLIIGALSVAATGIISAWRTSAKADKVIAAQVDTKTKLEEIHLSTNGNLSRLTEKIESLDAKSIIDTESIKALQEIVKNLTSSEVAHVSIPVPVPVLAEAKKK